MKKIISKCNGYKILNQDPLEMCISYIISQNNNVKRISKSINELCEKYGEKIIYNDNIYYLFPTYEQLKKLNIDDFSNLKVGFRAKYLYDFINKYETLKDINKLSTEDALKELYRVKGIGLKVASCILLFGYKRLDTFPIDTWVKQCISDKYNIKNDAKSIEEFAKNKYKNYSGLAIQYMFHSQRNK
jgi:N-glycosylase/DNA lyase